MIEKLDCLIDMLGECAELLWLLRTEQFREKFSEVISKLFEVVPQIIVSYSDEKMNDISEDALYWPNQINKIMGIVDGGNDIFALSDALYYELRANLIDYKATIIDRKMSV